MEHCRAKILVTDDDPQIRKLFTRLLTNGGYSVSAVESGSLALEVLKNQPVDLLVLDLNMPQPDGFDLLKELRVQQPGLRILVISGYLQGALLKASEILGATASLSKTEASRSLVKTVDTLLR